jgi:hypothetical protein
MALFQGHTTPQPPQPQPQPPQPQPQPLPQPQARKKPKKHRTSSQLTMTRSFTHRCMRQHHPSIKHLQFHRWNTNLVKVPKVMSMIANLIYHAKEPNQSQRRQNRKLKQPTSIPQMTPTQVLLICRIVASPSQKFMRRKRCREAEIAGLKEACNVLESETAFVQRKGHGMRQFLSPRQ